MTVHDTAASDDALVARLRAAGCVFAEDEAALLREFAAGDATVLDDAVARRCSGVPLEVVVGHASFGGLRVAVDPGVFVPRVRTEFVAALAYAQVRPGAVCLDLCCGTGAVGAVLATHPQQPTVLAADVDPASVACARRNLAPTGGTVWCGDLFDALPDRWLGRIDVVAVNAPYVPSDRIAHMPVDARDHEPRHALDGGPDGVALHRRVAAEAAPWLAPGAVVLVETSAGQADATAAAFARCGFHTEILRDDERDATAVRAQAPVGLSGNR